MARINKQAWAILSPDEQTAISLQYGLQKSSWESGEMMDKSHYKYLEIKYRAEKFLKMFTEHLEMYHEIVPMEILEGDGIAIKYLKYCVENRWLPRASVKYLNDNDDDRVYTLTQIHDRVERLLRKWNRSENIHEIQVFNLIKEFDRWNNYRILPKSIQEPSAFKRRIKSMYRKHIRALSAIPILSREKIREITEAKKSDSRAQWLPMFKNGGFELWKTRTNPQTVELLSDLCLYIFKDKGEATEYIENVYHYTNLSEKHCRDGITFWQLYRELIQRASNFDQVQKITATRRHLTLAMQKLEFF